MSINLDIPRDGFGRPLVMPPDGGDRRRAYQRCTTFVGVLENTWNIQQWEVRKVVEGMGQRPDLVLAASATDPDDKKGMQAIGAKAKEHALGSAAATTGTALHALTERVDRGEPLGSVPAAAEADIFAYQAATAALEHLAIEEFRVFDDWQIAGTADRICRYGDEAIVADVKTGSIDYGQGKIAMQLAMYAHSLPYDIATDRRSDRLPDLNLEKALIIHLPAGQAQCRLVWVDIRKGWEACGLAKRVWDWRKTKNLTWEDVPSDSLEALCFMAIRTCTSVEGLRDLWMATKRDGLLIPGFTEACAVRKAQLEGAA